jgi:hypothetical protein
MPWRMFAIGLPAQDSDAFQTFKSLAQGGRGGTRQALQLIETAAPEKHFPQDHHHPDIRKKLDGPGGGAGVLSKFGAAHGLSLQILKQQYAMPLYLRQQRPPNT